jgi:hypothetical protein
MFPPHTKKKSVRYLGLIYSSHPINTCSYYLSIKIAVGCGEPEVSEGWQGPHLAAHDGQIAVGPAPASAEHVFLLLFSLSPSLWKKVSLGEAGSFVCAHGEAGSFV